MLTESLELKDVEMRKAKKFDAVKQYARGKRHQTAMMERWARLEGENAGEERVKSGKGYVGYYSMHPGWVSTDGVANALPKFYASMAGKLRTPEQGADTILYLLTAEAKDLRPGAFYFDRAPVAKHITGGFTRYEPKQVDVLVSKLDALQAEGSVRSEKNLLKASGSFTRGSATKSASPPSETKTKRVSPDRDIR
jgi:dehydrogenase/reductase SDR family protein 12